MTAACMSELAVVAKPSTVVVEMSDGLTVSSSSKSDFLVNGKYRLVRKIGSGSFGDIYLGINVSNGEVGRAHCPPHSTMSTSAVVVVVATVVLVLRLK